MLMRNMSCRSVTTRRMRWHREAWQHRRWRNERRRVQRDLLTRVSTTTLAAYQCVLAAPLLIHNVQYRLATSQHRLSRK